MYYLYDSTPVKTKLITQLSKQMYVIYYIASYAQVGSQKCVTIYKSSII